MRISPSIIALLLSASLVADTMEGKVIKVTDGDTITILVGREQHRVRLQGIDAPERGQAYGRASGRSLARVLAGKQVRVEFDKRDRYGRIVGRVWVRSPDARCHTPSCPKTLDAGLYQLTVGMARWYQKYAGDQTPEARGQYEFAEIEARARRTGLWQEPGAIPPWDWRKGVRTAEGRSRAPAGHDPGFCDSHRFCSQMASCADARRALTECGYGKLDKDGDGVPCEALCR